MTIQGEQLKQDELVRIGAEGIQQFEDEFLIRYWDYNRILQKFSEFGFRNQIGMSQHFIGSGAHYFLIDR